MTVPSLRSHTDAVITTLEGAGLTVGDAKADGLTLPYAVVYSILGGRSFGTLEEPHDDAELVYQVTCVGETREQAEWVADKSMVLLGGIAVEGRSIAFVDIEAFPGTTVDRDVTPPRWMSTPRFRFTTTPA